MPDQKTGLWALVKALFGPIDLDPRMPGVGGDLTIYDTLDDPRVPRLNADLAAAHQQIDDLTRRVAAFERIRETEKKLFDEQAAKDADQLAFYRRSVNDLRNQLNQARAENTRISGQLAALTATEPPAGLAIATPSGICGERREDCLRVKENERRLQNELHALTMRQVAADSDTAKARREKATVPAPRDHRLADTPFKGDQQ